MLSDKLGHFLDKPLSSIAARVPLSPNFISLLGFILVLLSCMVLLNDIRMGALVLLPACLIDAIDGIVARSQGKVSLFGSFLDSLLDRYADAAILLSIAWNLGTAGKIGGVMAALISLVGSLIISYARAKAESLGIRCQVGLMERTERLLLLFVGAISGFIVECLWLLAILTHFTVLQRVLAARKLLKI